MTSITFPGLEPDKDIIVAGDLHGVWQPANHLINTRRPSIFIQCGDYGWWPKFHNTTKILSGVWRWKPGYNIREPVPWNQFGLRNFGCKVYFCPGNHEDWEDLDSMATSDDARKVEVSRGVFFMPRCSTLILPDGRTILFMGGALSIDREFRVLGRDWFYQETITHRDIVNLPECDIDIVISHTAPNEFRKEINRGDWRGSDSYWLEKFKDPSCDALSFVLNKYRPSFWFFGHYHKFKHSKWRNTRWFALNMSPEPGWWVYLPKG